VCAAVCTSWVVRFAVSIGFRQICRAAFTWNDLSGMISVRTTGYNR